MTTNKPQSVLLTLVVGVFLSALAGVGTVLVTHYFSHGLSLTTAAIVAGIAGTLGLFDLRSTSAGAVGIICGALLCGVVAAASLYGAALGLYQVNLLPGVSLPASLSLPG